MGIMLKANSEKIMTEYTIIRSSRKTVALQLDRDGNLIVRAPYRMSQKAIQTFVLEHTDWIEKKLKTLETIRQNRRLLTEQEREAGIRDALVRIPQRTAYFAQRMGVSYGRITIREQKTRWGSCSSEGNLNFNWKLVLMPERVLDYVVVHELAHRREMNHSERFWAVVAAVLPDYRERRQELKKYGSLL